MILTRAFVTGTLSTAALAATLSTDWFAEEWLMSSNHADQLDVL
jgi:hypothetical protein